MIELNIPLVKQSPGMCGPASLQSILLFYGNDIPEFESDVASLVDINLDTGAEPEDIIKIANNYGYLGEYIEGGTIELIADFLSQNIPVIVNWFSGNQGHYSVVSGLDDDDIYLMDPEFAEVRSIPINEFERLWFGEDDILDYNSQSRKMIVVHPTG